MVDRKPFYNQLRKLGFERKGIECGCVVYEKEFSESKVVVDIWVDGDHRVSNFHRNVYSNTGNPYGIMDSWPTSFKTIEGMVKAIEFEKTRFLKGIAKDHIEKVE